jgi:hypothetical protein
MPIEIGGEVRGLSEAEFLRVAYAVTGAAFALHKEYGAMFSVRLYKLELPAECQKLGFDSVAAELVEAHRAQTLNYLFLTGLTRAKLFNLGAASVQHEFVSTKLSPPAGFRQRVQIYRSGHGPEYRRRTPAPIPVPYGAGSNPLGEPIPPRHKIRYH